MMNDLLTKLPYNLPGTIYRSPLAFSPIFDPHERIMEAYVEAGVDTVVMLTSEEEAREITGRDLRAFYEDRGMDVIYSPIPDYSVPAPGQLQTPIQKTLASARSGETIVIHCHAGHGRTGIFAACLAKIVFNMTGEQAVQWVRQYIPQAVENPRQYQFVKTFNYQRE